MTGVIKLLLVDDDQGSGVQFTRPGGKPLPGNASYGSLVGKCVNDIGNGSDLVNDPASGKRCDLTGGATLKIKLDLDTFPTASFALPGGRAPVAGAFCVRDTEKDKCDPNYATAQLGRDPGTLIVTLHNLKSASQGEISPKFYSVNFAAPDVTGRTGLVSLDPKIINRPHLEAFLSLTTIIIIALILLPLTFFIGRAVGRRMVLTRRA